MEETAEWNYIACGGSLCLNNLSCLFLSLSLFIMSGERLPRCGMLSQSILVTCYRYGRTTVTRRPYTGFGPAVDKTAIASHIF